MDKMPRMGKKPKTMPSVVHVLTFEGKKIAVTNSELRNARKRYVSYRRKEKR